MATPNARTPIIPLGYDEKSKATLRELMVDYTNGDIYVISSTNRAVVFNTTKNLQSQINQLNIDTLKIHPDNKSIEVKNNILQIKGFDSMPDGSYIKKVSGQMVWVPPTLSGDTPNEDDGLSTDVLVLEPMLNKIYLQPTKRQRSSNIQITCDIILPDAIDEYCELEWNVVTLTKVSALRFPNNIIWENTGDKILEINTVVTYRFETWNYGYNWTCKAETRLDTTTDITLLDMTINSVIKTNKDSSNIFTTITLLRPDSTLILKSTLSGGLTPAYTTRTVVYYDQDGITANNVIVLKRLYDIDGSLTSEVIQ